MHLFSKMRKTAPTFAIPTQGELRLAKDLEELSFHRQLAGKTSVRITFPNGRAEAHKLNFICVISPVEGMYQGGSFEFQFIVPPDYPFRAPMVTCLTEVFHPNFDCKTGYVGLNLLYQDWKPVLSINTIVFGLQLLFLEPNADSVVNPVAAALLASDRMQFENAVRLTLGGGFALGRSWKNCFTEEFKEQGSYTSQFTWSSLSSSSSCASPSSSSSSSNAFTSIPSSAALHLQQLQFKACGFLQRDGGRFDRLSGCSTPPCSAKDLGDSQHVGSLVPSSSSSGRHPNLNKRSHIILSELKAALIASTRSPTAERDERPSKKTCFSFEISGSKRRECLNVSHAEDASLSRSAKRSRQSGPALTDDNFFSNGSSLALEVSSSSSSSSQFLSSSPSWLCLESSASRDPSPVVRCSSPAAMMLDADDKCPDPLNADSSWDSNFYCKDAALSLTISPLSPARDSPCLPDSLSLPLPFPTQMRFEVPALADGF